MIKTFESREHVEQVAGSTHTHIFCVEKLNLSPKRGGQYRGIGAGGTAIGFQEATWPVVDCTFCLMKFVPFELLLPPYLLLLLFLLIQCESCCAASCGFSWARVIVPVGFCKDAGCVLFLYA